MVTYTGSISLINVKFNFVDTTILFSFLDQIALPVILLLCLWILIRLFRSHRDSLSLERIEKRLEENLTRIDQLEQHIFRSERDQARNITGLREKMITSFSQQNETLQTRLSSHQTQFAERQIEGIKQLNDSLQLGMTEIQKQVSESLLLNMESLGKRVDSLTEKTEQRLHDIGGLVEKRLEEGFKKTTETFTDILKRLALIDEAQKKITELSSDVVSLQEILADKRSRGAFGEVQLNALIANVMPEDSFALQYTLPNGKVADCALFLPEPTGTIAIDSKFPLETYRLMTDFNRSDIERKNAEKQFKRDIQKHINDIAEKYIIPGTTSDGAVMFIPAESVFAEIQAKHPDLVDQAHSAHVWLVSPTTLWATLNTARAVLKDAETREQVDIIQEHLGFLAKDFQRFQKRMDDLARHINQAQADVEQVNTSAKKISSRFEKIERLELDDESDVTLSIENHKK